MRVLFVAKNYFGNPDLVRLSADLARRKHRVSVATCFRRIDKCRYKEGVNIYEIHPLITIHSIHSQAQPLSLPFSKIYRIVRDEEIEVIHALMDYSLNSAIAAFVSKVMGIPFVCTIQGVGARTTNPIINAGIDLYNRTVERLMAKRAKKVILLTKSLISRAKKLGAEEGKIAIIPSSVDYVHFDPGQPEVKRKAAMLRNELNIGDNIVVGYVGRLIPLKGLTYLMLAMKQIQDKHPNVVLLVIGDGPQRPQLEMMARDLKIKTIFTGWQADVTPYYAVMDIFVLPSLFEGLPNVMLEAMTMKKSIVATQVGGNADLITNGENGFLVPIRDNQRIASALEELIKNSDMRMRMGDINRQIVEKNFSWEIVVPKIEKLYNSLNNTSK